MLARFVMGRFEKWIIVAALIFFFATLAFPGAPFGFIKLVGLLTAVFLPLSLNRRRERAGSLLENFAGAVHMPHLLTLLAMPLLATTVYAFALFSQPSDATLRDLFELIPIAQAFFGAVIFVWAVIGTIRPFILDHLREKELLN